MMTERYVPLGDKMVSLPLLKKNKLVYRMMRKNVLGQANIPSVIVSNDVRNILLNYIINNRWVIKDYEELKGDDRTEINKIMYNVGLDFELGITHDHDNFEKDVAHFEKLKLTLGKNEGENKATLREMRLIVLRLIAGGRINRSKGFNLLYELATLSEF